MDLWLSPELLTIFHRKTKMSGTNVTGTARISANRARELEIKRSELQELYNKSKIYREKAGEGKFCAAELMEIVEESNRILASEEKKKDTKIDLPLIDGNVLNVAVTALKINASHLDVNTQTFDIDEFCEKLLPLITEDLDFLHSFSSTCFTAPVPSFPFLYGTQTEELSRKTVRRPRRSVDHVAPAEKKKPKNDITLTKEETEIQQVLEHMMRVLFVEYKRNGKKPVSYVRFVVDPESFSNTVENMFHVSFLIRDGFVSLKLDDKVAVLEPIYPKSQQTSEQEDKNQVIIDITMDDWEYLVKEFDIKEPMFRRDSS